MAPISNYTMLCDMINADNNVLSNIDANPIAVYGFFEDYSKYGYCSSQFIAERSISPTESMGHFIWDHIYWSHLINQLLLVYDLTNSSRAVRLYYIYNDRAPARFGSSNNPDKINRIIHNYIYIGVLQIQAMRSNYDQRDIGQYKGTQDVMICWDKQARDFTIFDMFGDMLDLGNILYLKYVTHSELNQITKYYGYKLYCNPNQKKSPTVLYVTEDVQPDLSEVTVSKIYECDICDEQFDRKSDYFDHNIKNHKGKSNLITIPFKLEGKCIDSDAQYSGPHSPKQHVPPPVDGIAVDRIPVDHKLSADHLPLVPQIAGNMLMVYKKNKEHYIRL